MNPFINLHAIIPSSAINGPGKRMVIFFQGCVQNCPGCFNPDTHAVKKVLLYKPDELLKEFISPAIEGITVSGGEPFYQRRGLLHLLKIARESYGLSTIVYTGFDYKMLRKDAICRRIFDFTDVLIDGRYEEEKKEPTFLARGSINQTFHFFTNTYQEDDFYLPAKAEIIIGRDGMVRHTGFSKINIS